MPIYEFQCQNCGREFERIQSFSDQSLPACPTCQSASVQRKLSSPAVHFKGSGWYITDSKNSAKSASATKTTDDGGDNKTSDDGSSQSTGEKGTAEKNGAEKSTTEKSETTTKSEPVKESSSAAKEPAA